MPFGYFAPTSIRLQENSLNNLTDSGLDMPKEKLESMMSAEEFGISPGVFRLHFEPDTPFGFDAQQSGVAGGVFDGGPFISPGRRTGSLNSEMASGEGSKEQEGVVRGSSV